MRRSRRRRSRRPRRPLPSSALPVPPPTARLGAARERARFVAALAEAALGPLDRAEALRQTLMDSKLAATVRSDIAHEIARRGGADNVVVYEYTDTSL